MKYKVFEPLIIFEAESVMQEKVLFSRPYSRKISYSLEAIVNPVWAPSNLLQAKRKSLKIRIFWKKKMDEPILRDWRRLSLEFTKWAVSPRKELMPSLALQISVVVVTLLAVHRSVFIFVINFSATSQTSEVSFLACGNWYWKQHLSEIL